MKMERRKMISKYLSDYRDQNPEIRSWLRLSRKTGKTERSLQRYYSQEQTPSKNSCAEILEELEVKSEEISDVLRDYYNASFIPKGWDRGLASNAAAFRSYASTDDKMVIWGLSAKKNGTSLDEISEYMVRVRAETVVETLLNDGFLREVNGRLRTDHAITRHPDVLLDTARRIAGVAYSSVSLYKTHSLVKVLGWSKAGKRVVDGIVDEFKRKLHECSSIPANIGDEPVLLGLTVCKLGEKVDD